MVECSLWTTNVVGSELSSFQPVELYNKSRVQMCLLFFSTEQQNKSCRCRKFMTTLGDAPETEGTLKDHNLAL